MSSQESRQEGRDADLYKLEKETFQEVSQLKSDLAVLKSTVATMEKLLEQLVTRPEFAPVKLLAYGMAGSLLAGVVGAILSGILRQ